MKKIFHFLFALLILSLSACEDVANDKAEITTPNSNTTALPAEGGECLTLIINANGSWILSTDEPWVTLSSTKGIDNQIVKVSLTYNSSIYERTATITIKSGSAKNDISFTQIGRSIIEIPQSDKLCLPKRNSQMEYKEYYVTYNGNNEVFNYAIEWNPLVLHANWVALEFNAITRLENVKRTNEWNWDTSLTGTIEESMHKSDGFDKGHLCASSERLYSKEANQQTFYYSNISPMISEFNQGYWSELEKLILKWCHSTSYDKVYITKGGTINNPLKNFTGSNPASDNVIPKTDAEGKTKHGLFVPKYYFIAVMTEKDNTFNSIGFYVEHTEGLPSNPTPEQLKQTAMSIDALEELTSLDFFCAMPDEYESNIEATFNDSKWTW